MVVRAAFTVRSDSASAATGDVPPRDLGCLICPAAMAPLSFLLEGGVRHCVAGAVCEHTSN